MRDGIIQAQGVPQIAVQRAAPIVDILLAQRHIQPVRMAESRDILSAGAFAEHLFDRITRNDMDKKKDDRHHQPYHWDGVDQSDQHRPQSLHQEAFSG
jgi:hypothetical protein